MNAQQPHERFQHRAVAVALGTHERDVTHERIEIDGIDIAFIDYPMEARLPHGDLKINVSWATAKRNLMNATQPHGRVENCVSGRTFIRLPHERVVTP